MKDIPKEFLDKADELKVPVIILPEEIAYIDVISPILEEIVNREAKKLQYTITVHEKLTNIVLGSSDSNKLSKELSAILNRPIIVTDYKHEVLTKYSLSYNGKQLLNKLTDVRTLLREEFIGKSDIYKSVKCTKDFGDILLRPILFGNQFYGTLIILEAENIQKLEEIAINQACTAFAIILMNKIAVEQSEARKKEDFLTDLLTEKFKTDEEFLAAAEKFGWDMNNKRMVLYCKFYFSQKPKLHFKEELKWKLSELSRKDSISNINLFTNKSMVIFLKGVAIVAAGFVFACRDYSLVQPWLQALPCNKQS